LTSSAEVKFVVPLGPLAGGTVPVPPVRSTAILTPAGLQVPEVPAMLQRVTFFVASLQIVGVRESSFAGMFGLRGVDLLGDPNRKAICENVLDATELRSLSSRSNWVDGRLNFVVLVI
jgi:hypothetical protein